MTQLWPFLLREYRSFTREPMTLFWTVLFPVLMLLVLGSAISRNAPPQSDVAVVDHDHGPWAQRLQDDLKAAFWLRTKDVTPEHADVVLTIPEGLSARLSAGGHAQLELGIRGTDVQRVGAAEATIRSLLLGWNERASSGRLPIALVVDGAGDDTPPAGKPEPRYADFLLPGLIAVTVLSLALFSTCVQFSSHRAEGLFRRLWLSPASPWAFMTAHLIGVVATAVLIAAVLLATGRFALATQWPRSSFSCFAMVVIGALSLTPLGLAISARITRPRTAQGVANLVYFPLIFLSGAYFPTDFLPSFLRGLVNVLPLKPFIDGLRLASDGAGVASLAAPCAVLFLWMAVGLVCARGVFRWQD